MFRFVIHYLAQNVSFHIPTLVCSVVVVVVAVEVLVFPVGDAVGLPVEETNELEGDSGKFSATFDSVESSSSASTIPNIEEGATVLNVVTIMDGVKLMDGPLLGICVG
jgi:hypothetical protein